MSRFGWVPAAPVRAFQSLVEFGALWDAVAALSPQVVVEVGSLFGGTLWYWLQLPSVQHVVSVDLVADQPHVHDEVLAGRALWHTWPDQTPARPELHVYDADSHDPATLAAVAAALPGGVDVLFLDGDHTYPGVRADWDLWHLLVRPGGLVAFHDTVANADRDEPGVRQLVDELRWQHPSTTWFEPDGVGITAFQL